LSDCAGDEKATSHLRKAGNGERARKAVNIWR